MAQQTAAISVTCCMCAHGDKTSYSLNTGTNPEAHGAAWTVSAGAGDPVQVPAVNAGQTAWQYVALMNGPLWPAHWVTPPASLPVVNGQVISVAGAMRSGTYSYHLTIHVPNCVMNASKVLTGKVAADNHAKIYWDQALLAQSPNNLGYQAASVVTFSFAGIMPGDHVLRVDVDNTDDQSPTGMIFEGALSNDCPPTPELTGVRAGQGRG
jgi:hypothetical protein